MIPTVNFARIWRNDVTGLEEKGFSFMAATLMLFDQDRRMSINIYCLPDLKLKNMLPHLMDEPRPYILMIDDDEDDLEMLSSSLSAVGIKTQTFSAAWKAVYYLNMLTATSDVPEFILLDYNMPGMNGSQVLELLKGNTITARIPVVIYSTHLSPVFRSALIGLGAFDCLAKPSLFKDFTAQVEYFKSLAHSLSA